MHLLDKEPRILQDFGEGGTEVDDPVAHAVLEALPRAAECGLLCV